MSEKRMSHRDCIRPPDAPFSEDCTCCGYRKAVSLNDDGESRCLVCIAISDDRQTIFELKPGEELPSA